MLTVQGNGGFYGRTGCCGRAAQQDGASRREAARLRRPAPSTHLPRLRALSHLDARFVRTVCVHMVRRARPHRRSSQLGRSDRHRMVGARICDSVHRTLLHRPHVHAPRRIPLRIEHAQARDRTPHARGPRLLRYACERSAPARGGWLRPRDRRPARPQAAGHRGLNSHDRRHVRAVLRLRLATGRGRSSSASPACST